MPPKKKSTATIKSISIKLINTYLLPNPELNSIQEALDFRATQSTNIDLWDKLSVWTATNGSDNKEINLESFLDNPDYNLNDVFFVPENPIDTTTEVEYSPIVEERLRQIENAKRLEAEEKKKK